MRGTRRLPEAVGLMLSAAFTPLVFKNFLHWLRTPKYVALLILCMQMAGRSQTP